MATLEKQKSSQESYDLIVLGDHPSALLSACLAAKQGLSVYVLGCGTRLTPSISRQGMLLDPETNFISGLGPNGLLLKLLERMGLSEIERKQSIEALPLPQLISPQMTLKMPLESSLWPAELLREWGETNALSKQMAQTLEENRSIVMEFWNHLPDRLTLKLPEKKSGDSKRPLWLPVKERLQRRSVSLRRKSLSWMRDPEAKNLIKGWLGATSTLGQIHSIEPSLQLVERILLNSTGAKFRGGMAGFRKTLAKMAADLGATVQLDVDCKQVLVQRGRFTGVQAREKGGIISGKVLILGCALDQIDEKLSSDVRMAHRGFKKTVLPDGWSFTLALQLKAEGIPVGMASQNVWVETGAPPLHIEMVDPQDYGLNQPDTATVLLRAPLAYDLSTLQVEAQVKQAYRMLKQATQVFPFLKEHLLSTFPAVNLKQLWAVPGSKQRKAYPTLTPSDLATEREFTDVYPYRFLEVIPDGLRVRGNQGLGLKSGVSGIFSLTNETYPEHGTFGWTIGALESAAWLAHRSGLTGPLT